MKEKRLPVFHLTGVFFGGIWAAGGSMAFSGTVRDVLLLSAMIVTVVLAVRLIRRPQANGSQGVSFNRSPYMIAVVLEALGIAAVVILLPRHGLEGYVMQAVGIVVGLHFLGLWKSFQSTHFLWITTGMCLVSGLAMFLPPATDGMQAGNALAGFGNALVLWWGASIFRQ